MASALSQQISCAVCLNDLTDPVSLKCDHSYCRICISQILDTGTDISRCPECRTPFTQDDVKPSRVLRNIVDAAKHLRREFQVLTERALSSTTNADTQNVDSTEQCLEHNEPFKLFCETDDKLICVICKEEEKHQGHRLKTSRDVYQARKEKTNENLKAVSRENKALLDMTLRQQEEMVKTKEQSEMLSVQIFGQFELMHKFLRYKEEEVRKLLREKESQIMDDMEINRFKIEDKLSDVMEKEGILTSALETNQPCQFLQWWDEYGRSVIDEAQISSTLEQSAEDQHVLPNTLFLGPYETHLQFFVWKEMLTAIQPVPHHHMVKVMGDQGVKVSASGRSIQCKKEKFMKSNPMSPWLRSDTAFTTGQQYWEVEVGQKLEWDVGLCSCKSGEVVKDTMLCLSLDSGYCIEQARNADRQQIHIVPQPWKIGVYLDCERKQVSFYNADNMILIDTKFLSKKSPHSLCLSPGQYLNGKNSDPLTVCWY